MDSTSEKTALSKKQKNVPFGKQEILLLLRAYQTHPCSWNEIISEIKENGSSLPSSTQQLYKNSSMKQLRDRIGNKMSKLMKQDNDDLEIRAEIQKVRKLETQLVPQKSFENQKSCGNTQISTKRKQIALALSDDDDDNDADDHDGGKDFGNDADNAEEKDDAQPGPSQTSAKKNPKKVKRESFLSVSMKNQVDYNKFITCKIPKLFRMIGVSESESDD